MQFFGLKSCDTCRKALRTLADAGYDPDVTDVRANGLTPAQIKQIVDVFGGKAVNRASTTWRSLSDAEKDQTPEALIAAHPTLMKRPVIEMGGAWTLGWSKDVQAKYAA